MSRKPVIGFVSQDDARNIQSWSGIPFHLFQALSRQDVSVELFSPLERNFRYLLAPAKLAARFRGKDAQFDHFSIALRSYASRLKREMQRAPVDVILSISSIPVTLLTCSKPIVFFTDAVFHSMPGYYGAPWDKLTEGAIERGRRQEERALKNCTFAVYASRWAAEEARKIVPATKVRVVHFGASMPVDHDEDAVQGWSAQRFSSTLPECRLLFVGLDWFRKGGDIAVETARILNDIGVSTKLTIVGARPDAPLPEFVEVLGFIDKNSEGSQKHLSELFRRSTFFILPTVAEAAGIVFCEASAFGLPSITYITGGTGDYVRDQISGITLEPGSGPEIFAANIKRVLSDRNLYSALCVGAFREYRNRLNWDSAAASLVSVCHEAMEQVRADTNRTILEASE